MWEDECFDEIQVNDKIYYYNDRLQECSGRAIMQGPMGWVISCDHGSVVVNEGDNYAGHTPAKKDRRPDWLGKFLNQNDTEWNGK